MQVSIRGTREVVRYAGRVRIPLRLGACLALCAVVLAMPVACGLGLSGTGAADIGGPEGGESGTSAIDTGAIDTGVADDSTIESGMGEAGRPDSAVPEAGCTGVLCSGACTTASDCRTCNGAPLLCASTGQCVASCQGCKDTSDAAMPIECFACDSNHQDPIGTCQYDDPNLYCLSGDYTGQYQGGSGYQCTCADAGAASCPGATQVCVPLGNVGATFCLTCGEATLASMQGRPCKGGGACQANAAVCQ